MIARIWHGYTTAENASKYEAIKKRKMLPGISTVRGYIGSYLLRRMNSGEVEFTVITLWESLDAIRDFVGADYEAAVVPPDCEALLSRYDERSAHYEILTKPSARDASSGPDASSDA
jgi:heme-degrading monooxygenase HmoA